MLKPRFTLVATASCGHSDNLYLKFDEGITGHPTGSEIGHTTPIHPLCKAAKTMMAVKSSAVDDGVLHDWRRMHAQHALLSSAFLKNVFD